MKWIETITPKQAAEELGVPYHGWMREMDRAWISEDQIVLEKLEQLKGDLDGGEVQSE